MVGDDVDPVRSPVRSGDRPLSSAARVGRQIAQFAGGEIAERTALAPGFLFHLHTHFRHALMRLLGSLYDGEMIAFGHADVAIGSVQSEAQHMRSTTFT